MNLRVRSVTGCSRSAMFAGCILRLAMTLITVEVVAVTNRTCDAKSSIIEQNRVRPSVICVCAR